jgi:2-dehydro-3-deoxygluconokinase
LSRIVVIGEAMLELARAGEDWQLGYGGDTLNTAIHLARAGHDVAYLTALGSDPMSADLKERWRGEGLDTALVLDHPGRSTGLYAISTDAAGERSFSYWRDTSAAREMLALPGSAAALAAAERADLIVFSLITLAILPPDGRAALLETVRRVRAAGGLVAFDGNYRARLWTSASEAAAARDAAIACASLGLPTLEDERAIAGTGIGAVDVAKHWQRRGCAETIVKLGPAGCLLPDGTIIAPDQVLAPVDTSGAGDAFNAGYLDARLRVASPAEAARSGHALAGWTIMRPGAIPSRD